jgi:(2S)-methylsuccinyl-CoA dehydrogenase
MSDTTHEPPKISDVSISDVPISEVAQASRVYSQKAVERLRDLISSGGKVDRVLLAEHQFAAHALAWIAAYGTAVDAAAAQLGGVAESDTSLRTRVLAFGISEYVQQMGYAIALSQGEMARPSDLGLADAAQALNTNPANRRLAQITGHPEFVRNLVADLAKIGPDAGLDNPGEDETLRLIRDQCRRFVDTEISPKSQVWHATDSLIPDEVISDMAELGLFGLTISPDHGGLGLGAEATALVAEELCRGYIGVGSIGTRADIAAELIRGGGTDAQRAYYLPRIASADLIPTAVFTEPEVGSDLGAIATRARREGDVYLITGTKIWITHGARADLMTLMVRTDPSTTDYRGLTMLLAEKPRGTDANPFPADGMSGSEIPVLGYRGMKEYEIRFDEYAVPVENVLGGQEGDGFKQLMQTFETARIQTAGRALGVARSALELGLDYALERQQFDRPIVDFPRIARKLAAMVSEIAVVREMVSTAAAQRDNGRRADIEAGMAKLLAARLAWSAADNTLQIHGGTGYATEHPAARLLCDARILSIFEGTAEIQADVIARGLATRRPSS